MFCLKPNVSCRKATSIIGGLGRVMPPYIAAFLHQQNIGIMSLPGSRQSNVLSRCYYRQKCIGRVVVDSCSVSFFDYIHWLMASIIFQNKPVILGCVSDLVPHIEVLIHTEERTRAVKQGCNGLLAEWRTMPYSLLFYDIVPCLNQVGGTTKPRIPH